MKTIDWPGELTQTYINADTTSRVITIDDDHQAVGKHGAQCGPSGARELATAHRAVADALDAAADAIDMVPPSETGPTDAPPAARG